MDKITTYQFLNCFMKISGSILTYLNISQIIVDRFGLKLHTNVGYNFERY